MKRIFAAFFALLLCLLSSSAEAAGKSEKGDFAERAPKLAQVTGVRLSTSDEKVRIVIDTDAPVQYKTMALSQPDRIVVDVQGAWLSPKIPKEREIDSRFATKMRIGQFDKNTVRVVVETSVGKNNMKIFALKGDGTSAPGRVVMDFGDLASSSDKVKIKMPEKKTDPVEWSEPTEQPKAEKKETKKEEKKESPKQEKKEKAEKSEAAVSEEAASDWVKKRFPNLERAQEDGDESSNAERLASITGLLGRTIVIDPGHGGSDSGAIGVTGVTEKSVVLRVSMVLKKILEAEGAIVHLTREKDTEVSPKGSRASDIEELAARCEIANKHNADVFVSVHMDAFTNNTAKGTTSFYFSKGSKESRDLADKVRAGVVEQLGTQSRGTQPANFYVLKHTNMPATLIEIAFLSNKEEESMMDAQEGIEKAAQGIADGIADFFG